MTRLVAFLRWLNSLLPQPGEPLCPKRGAIGCACEHCQEQAEIDARAV